MNLAPVWVKHGLFGKGIKIVLVDDGLKTTHPELADNFVSTRYQKTEAPNQLVKASFIAL